MAKYRVKEGAKMAGGIGASLLIGTEFEWDGETVDSDGDVVVQDCGWVAPEFVELITEGSEPAKVVVTEEPVVTKIFNVRLTEAEFDMIISALDDRGYLDDIALKDTLRYAAAVNLEQR